MTKKSNAFSHFFIIKDLNMLLSIRNDQLIMLDSVQQFVIHSIDFHNPKNLNILLIAKH